jgi:hypothetical protein
LSNSGGREQRVVEGRVAGLARLRLRLKAIAGKAAAARAHQSHPDYDQNLWTISLAHEQLCAVIDFVESDPACASIAELCDLRSGLLELASGRRVEWLAPQHNQHNIGASRLDQKTAALRGGYAAIMDFLVHPGDMTEERAAKFVVEHGRLRRAAKSRKNAAPDWKRVYNWRQRVIGHPDPSYQDEIDGYRAMHARIAAFDGAEIPTTAILLLGALNQVRGRKPI